VVRTILTA